MGKKAEKMKKAEKLGFKNHELLRFHLTEKMDELNALIEKKEASSFSELSGDIFASLVDLLIVILFNSNDSLTFKVFGYKVGISKVTMLIICIILFPVTSKIYNFFSKKLHNYKIRKRNLKDEKDDEDIKSIVRQFDNIAFDYLLLCHDYIDKFNEETDKNIKEFYMHEIVYYCQNSIDRFSPIYTKQDLYICRDEKDRNDEYKVEVYRVNNFIKILKDINAFIILNKNAYEKDALFYNKIIGINDTVECCKLID